MVNFLGKKLEKEQEQQLKYLVLILLAGAGFYFFIYLPQEETRKFEMEIQTDIDKLKEIKIEEYSKHLTKLQGYLKWKEGSEIQQEVLTNKEIELKRAIDWLVEAEKNLADANSQARTQEEIEKKKKEFEMIKKKKFHWLREPKSWADDYLMADRGKYSSGDSIEKTPDFSSFSHYKIHFPPILWNSLNSEQQKLAKEKGYSGLSLDEETKIFKFNREIEDWYDNVSINPVRGKPDHTTGKDNNALFYGTEGTGKTSIVRKLCYETNCYPLVEIKGSTLSPTKIDSNLSIAPLDKFILTLCDIDHTLVDNFGFRRETNGEVRYILFVDEADLVSRTAMIFDATYLVFLKECMEQISKEKQPENLWIFATNHIEMIARPVYRPGRLSNPLDFSWTLGDFVRYSREVEIKDEEGNLLRKEDITQKFPNHWHKTATLNEEDNKWVNRFNKKYFDSNFLPFWKKFINHPETLKKLPEIKKEDATSEYPEQPGIQLGEFFEFFWNLKDSGQLPNFQGKWDPPRKPKLEESIPKITEAIDTRLKEIHEQTRKIKDEIQIAKQNHSSLIQMGITQITGMLAEIGKKI